MDQTFRYVGLVVTEDVVMKGEISRKIWAGAIVKVASLLLPDFSYFRYPRKLRFIHRGARYQVINITRQLKATQLED